MTQAEYARALALHEAAHAVVAQHFGYRVQEVRIDLSKPEQKSGQCVWEGPAILSAFDYRARLLIALAGNIEQMLVYGVYVGGAEDKAMAYADLTALETPTAEAWRQAHQAVYDLLATPIIQARVMALADRLLRDHVVMFDHIEPQEEWEGDAA